MAFLCLIAAPEGIDALHKAHPDIRHLHCSKDERLRKQHILQDLEMQGRRSYGTK